MMPAQCRAARALLDLSQTELARAAGLGLSTVVDFEKRRRKVSIDAVKTMQLALERAGITFNQRGVAVALTQLKGGFEERSSLFDEFRHVRSKSKKATLSSAQIRAARALLRWSAAD